MNLVKELTEEEHARVSEIERLSSTSLDQNLYDESYRIKGIIKVLGQSNDKEQQKAILGFSPLFSAPHTMEPKDRLNLNQCIENARKMYIERSAIPSSLSLALNDRLRLSLDAREKECLKLFEQCGEYENQIEQLKKENESLREENQHLRQSVTFSTTTSLGEVTTSTTIVLHPKVNRFCTHCNEIIPKPKKNQLYCGKKECQTAHDAARQGKSRAKRPRTV